MIYYNYISEPFLCVNIILLDLLQPTIFFIFEKNLFLVDGEILFTFSILCEFSNKTIKKCFIGFKIPFIVFYIHLL